MKRFGQALALSFVLHFLAAAMVWRLTSKSLPPTPLATPPASRDRIWVSLWAREKKLSPTTPKVSRRGRPLKSDKNVSNGLAPKLTHTESVESALEREEGSSTSTEQAGPAAQALNVSLLHQKLSEAALQCYPKAAQRFRWTGKVDVSFCFDDPRVVKSVTVEKTSGHALLDQAATDCVIPKAFPVEAPLGCYSLPVRFVAQGNME